MSVIRATRVCRSFAPPSRCGAVRGIHDIDLEVAAGECVGLIGRNGCGKTTLLRVLAGILDPDSGTLEIDAEMAALIEAGGGIEIDVSGAENLRNLLVLQGVGQGRLEEVWARAATFADLGDALADPVRTYSTGMVMRLAFAAVIFLDAELLLVDEVLSVGDPVFQRRCANEIRRFVNDGGTIILASHNYHEIAALCERVVLMEHGRIVVDGPADDVYRAFWQRNEDELSRITPHGAPRPTENLLKAHAPLAENTGEVRILEVRFVDGDGGIGHEFNSLAAFAVEIDVEALRPLEHVICRVQFHRSDGLFVMGSNTRRHRFEPGPLAGRSTFRLAYPSLPLARGEYFVSVGLWPDEYRSFIAERAYDYHENSYVIAISQPRRAGGGLIASEHRWSLRRGET